MKFFDSDNKFVRYNKRIGNAWKQRDCIARLNSINTELKRDYEVNPTNGFDDRLAEVKRIIKSFESEKRLNELCPLIFK